MLLVTGCLLVLKTLYRGECVGWMQVLLRFCTAGARKVLCLQNVRCNSKENGVMFLTRQSLERKKLTQDSPRQALHLQSCIVTHQNTPSLESIFFRYLYLSTFDGLVGKVPEANLQGDFMVLTFWVLPREFWEISGIGRSDSIYLRSWTPASSTHVSEP